MPYKNVPQGLWGKMDSCVKDVMGKQGVDKSSAVAICYDSVVAGKHRAKAGTYSASDTESLPSHVKGERKSKRQKWAKTHNATFRACKAKGGTDEACSKAALKFANTTLKKKRAVDSTDDTAPESGTFIALVVPPDIAAQLAVDGGENAEELHLTLAYLNADADHAALLSKLNDFAAQYAPVSGTLNAITTFENGDSRALVALFDSPQFPNWRQKLVEALGVDAFLSQDHGWIPHVTLEYLEPDQELDASAAIGTDITFTTLRLVTNSDGQSADVELTGSVARDIPDDGTVTSRYAPYTRILFLSNLENDPQEDQALIQESRLVRDILNELLPTTLVFVSSPADIEQALAKFDSCDTLIFNWAEGLPGWIEGGETCTDIVERAGFAHTGSPAGTQRLIFDRGQTFLFLRQLGILAPQFQMVYSPPDVGLWEKWPALIRPNDCHGSEDLEIVESAEEAESYIEHMVQEHQLPAILIEYISPAREFSVGLWSDGLHVEAFPIAEANFGVLSHDIKDEADKSAAGPDVDEVNFIPADIPPELEQTLVDRTAEIFRAVGAKIYFRADWRIYDGETEPICIDVNPEPEVSTESLMGEMAKVAGLTFEDLVWGILDRAITYYARLGATDTAAEEVRSMPMNTAQRLWLDITRAFAPFVSDGPTPVASPPVERAKPKSGKGSYPWNQCIKEQTAKYGADKAPKICASIKAKSQGRARSIDDEQPTDFLLPEGFDIAAALVEIEREMKITPLPDQPVQRDLSDELLWHQIWEELERMAGIDDSQNGGMNGDGMNGGMNGMGMDGMNGMEPPDPTDILNLHHLELYYDSNGKLYLLASQEGHLVRMDVNVDAGDHVTLGDMVEVAQANPEIAQRSLKVIRSSGKPARWLNISASSVLNRVGEIDSTQLFDNFIKRAQLSGQYPVLTFWHQRGLIRFGQADFLAREGNLYLASGAFDDTPIARAAADELERHPDQWGTSIGYLPQGGPVLMEVAREIRVPVYTDGIHAEISILPETSAANLYTRVGVAREVKNHMDKKTYDALVALVGEAQAKQFAGQVDATNREIDQRGLITRAQPGVGGGGQPTAQPAAPAPVQPLVLDDAAVQAIAQALVERHALNLSNGDLTDMHSKLREMHDTMGSMVTKLDGAMQKQNSIETRLAALERTDAEKQREWQADLPAQPTATVTYRPSVARATEEPDSTATIASATVAKMKTREPAPRR